MTSLDKGDYVSFTRCVQPPIFETYRDATKKAYKVLKQPACWVDISGSGQVLKVSKGLKKLGDEKHRTARVDAGPWLGVLTVSIDDAVLVGVQQSMDILHAPVFATNTMYDVQGEGA